MKWPEVLPEPQLVEARSINMLTELVEECLSEMSYQSLHAKKGQELQRLLDRINNTQEFTQLYFNRIVKDLANTIMAPRKICFFQAAYAETRSAKPFIRAMINPKRNDLLSLSTVVLGNQVDLSQETEKDVIGRIQAIRNKGRGQGNGKRTLAPSSLS
jgi:hypothetical protein